MRDSEIYVATVCDTYDIYKENGRYNLYRLMKYGNGLCQIPIAIGKATKEECEQIARESDEQKPDDTIALAMGMFTRK